MKPLILAIAKRLIEKTMVINSDDFMANISVGFDNGNLLTVTLFDTERDNNTFLFQNSNDDIYLKSTYKTVLKLIRRELNKRVHYANKSLSKFERLQNAK